MAVLKPKECLFLAEFAADSISKNPQQPLTKTNPNNGDDFAPLTEDGASMFSGLLSKSTLPKVAVAIVLSAACIGESLLVLQWVSSPMQSAIK